MTIADDRGRSLNVQLSPDGRWVAFDSDREGERGIYVADRRGAGVHRVSGDGTAWTPTWSPDAKTVAFVRAEPDHPIVSNIWLLDMQTATRRPLTTFHAGETGRAAWLPDGHHVCYTHDERIFVQDIDMGTVNIYESPVPGYVPSNPAVSPNGRHVIVQVVGHGGWLLDLHDRLSRGVVSDPTAEVFTWSDDGRRVAYHSRRDDAWGVWIMAPGGS
jgi:TolB protein